MDHLGVVRTLAESPHVRDHDGAEYDPEWEDAAMRLREISEHPHFRTAPMWVRAEHCLLGGIMRRSAADLDAALCLADAAGLLDRPADHLRYAVPLLEAWGFRTDRDRDRDRDRIRIRRLFLRLGRILAQPEPEPEPEPSLCVRACLLLAAYWRGQGRPLRANPWYVRLLTRPETRGRLSAAAQTQARMDYMRNVCSSAAGRRGIKLGRYYF